MPTKRKTPAPHPAAARSQDDERHVAKVMTDGSVNAAVVTAYLPSVNGGGVDAGLLAETMTDQAAAAGRGDLATMERMLWTQAVALQGMFTDLALRAKAQTGLAATQGLTTLALKAASASRAAIVALAELRQPRTAVFTRQANIATGPQQVNNQAPAALSAPHPLAELDAVRMPAQPAHRERLAR